MKKTPRRPKWSSTSPAIGRTITEPTVKILMQTPVIVSLMPRSWKYSGSDGLIMLKLRKIRKLMPMIMMNGRVQSFCAIICPLLPQRSSRRTPRQIFGCQASPSGRNV